MEREEEINNASHALYNHYAYRSLPDVFKFGAKWADENKHEESDESIDENTIMLKEILEYVRKINNDEYITKKQLHDFINNVVADLFADMLLQPKGRGHIDKEFINDVINKMK